MNLESTLSSEATQSVAQSIQPTSDPVAVAGLWMGRLDLFSSIFMAVIGVVLGILAILTWSNKRQKEEADKQLESINEVGKKISNLYSQFNDVMGEAKEILATVNQQHQKASNLLEEAHKTLESAKAKGSKVSELQKKMENLSVEMASTASAISSASISLPYAPQHQGGAVNQYGMQPTPDPFAQPTPMRSPSVSISPSPSPSPSEGYSPFVPTTTTTSSSKSNSSSQSS